MRLITGDTDQAPFGGGSHSGRSMRLGAVVMAKARNQNSDANAPMKPANSEGFQARAIAHRTWGSRNAR